MKLYEIVETDAGLTLVDLEPGTLPEVAAERAHGELIEEVGPFADYEDAYDAMISLDDED